MTLKELKFLREKLDYHVEGGPGVVYTLHGKSEEYRRGWRAAASAIDTYLESAIDVYEKYGIDVWKGILSGE